jgi:tRNA splicing endonuclease
MVTKEKYQELEEKYFELKRERDDLKEKNLTLEKLAYKTGEQIQEEIQLDIYEATSHKDSLLTMMELRENKGLSYEELKERVTEPNSLYLHLAGLRSVGFIKEEKGKFYSKPRSDEFLSKRNL